MLFFTFMDWFMNCYLVDTINFYGAESVHFFGAYELSNKG